MFRLYSKGCEYTLRALVYMLAAGENSRFRAADVCEAANIPEAYTRKTFQALVQTGFLKAVSGPGGGYTLVQNPGKITVLQVVMLIDGEATYEQCVLGLPFCSDKKACELHHAWLSIKKNLLKELSSKTLNDLAKPISEKWQGVKRKKTS